MRRRPCVRPKTYIGCPAIVDFSEQRAMLLVAGDEDRATQGSRRGALSRALQSRSDVVVDLSQLEYADPSLMLDLAMVARRLRKRGRKMLLRGAQPQIRRLIELVGLDRMPGVLVVGPSFA
ncbi:MAG TPA: STAS domain-containing protein [Solirubrobacteraceae bacterium]